MLNKVSACKLAPANTVKLEPSQAVSPCFRSNNDPLSSTDYARTTFVPYLMKRQGASSSKEREFTAYLKDTGILKKFATSIVTLYASYPLPEEENLIEVLMGHMGYYQLPTRGQVNDLLEIKHLLLEKEKELLEEKSKFLAKLDKFENSMSNYALLDQDEILPPRPETATMNLDQTRETFESLMLPTEPTDDQEKVDLKISQIKLPGISSSDFSINIQCSNSR